MIGTVDLLDTNGQRNPNGLALHDYRTSEKFSFAELDQRVAEISAKLNHQGIGPGDRVGVCSEHGWPFVGVVHAIWRCGGCCVPIDPNLPAEQIRERCNRVNGSVILTRKDIQDFPTISFDALDESAIDGIAPQVADRTSVDDAAILFTSGSTGTARPVRLTDKNLLASALASTSRLGTEPTDRWLSCLAPYHMGGFAPIVRAMLNGSGLVTAPFSFETITSAITESRATVLSLVPTMLRRCLENDVPLHELRVLLVGGDRTPPELIERTISHDIPIYVTYGMTEASSQIATATPELSKIDVETVGRPLRWTTVTVESNDEEGELRVQGPTITPGYVDTRDSDRITDNGCLRTGDSGYVRDGYVYVTGRIDDRIVSGGVTVDLKAVETKIRTHPSVRDAAVIGVSDTEWGERIHAVVVWNDSAPGDIDSFLASTLRPAARPKRIDQIESIPRTASGTIDRTAVYEYLCETGSLEPDGET